VEVGSALSRTEPLRRKGSCGIVTIRERIISRGRNWRSNPSILMLPESKSTRRRRTERSVLLPLLRLDNYDLRL
jgi:hypothetical protein